VQRCLQIGVELTTALEHLHNNGLVHRDIKLSNIIFVNGHAKLADIGLVTDSDATLPFVGTEDYCPPEGPGTPRADLYKPPWNCVSRTRRKKSAKIRF
jgi:eukaryotic-like serine/threonine-protein kinase